MTENGKGRQNGCVQKVLPTCYWQECKKTFSLAWALMLTQLSQTALQPVATMFGGHLGKYELDAIALANSMINVFGNSVVMGTSTACDTYFAQAQGKKEYKVIGVILQRSIYIHMLLLLILIAIYLNLGQLLILCGQNPVVARLTQEYVEVFLPGLFFLFLYTLLRKYLACQNIVMPPMIFGFLGISIAALFQYINIYVLDWGIPGSSLAQVYGCAVMVVATFTYIIVSKAYKDTWDGLKWQAVEQWGPFTRLAFHGMIMVCIEWWAFEIILLLTGLLGTTQLAAAAVMLNTTIFPFAIGSGFTDASAIRVGQTLGADRPLEARIATKVGIVVAALVATLIVILLITLRYEIPKLFTSDLEVIDLAANIMSFTAVAYFFDGVAYIAKGVFRGTGMQLQGTIFVICMYYGIGFPIGIPLMFCSTLNVLGGFVGLTCALISGGIGIVIFVVFIMDYEKAAKQAALRIAKVQCKDGYETAEELQVDSNMKETVSEPWLDENSCLLKVNNGASSTFENTGPGRRPDRRVVIWCIGAVVIVLVVLLIGIICRLLFPCPIPSKWMVETQSRNGTAI